jgi:hypothetical protein
MNELQMISELLDETPSERTVAQGRERLRSEIADPRPAAPARARRRLSLPRWGLGLGLAGAAGAAAVAVAVAGTTSPASPPGGTATQDLSARTVLLAAADRATTAPTAQGAYWRVRYLEALPFKVGPRGRQYTIEELRINETWTDRQGRSWTGDRVAGARPKTPADAAAWKRDGSPTKWDMGPGDTVGGGHVFRYATPQPGRLVKKDPPYGFMVAERWMTFRQLQALPTNPQALRAKLTPGDRPRADGEKVPADAQDGWTAGALGALLAEVPAPPQVRGAAYRALAAMPTARNLGRVKDAQGRTGIGIVITDSSGGGTTTTRLIIDPNTSLVLSSGVAAGRAGVAKPDKERDTVYLEVGWTDAEPGIPELP